MQEQGYHKLPLTVYDAAALRHAIAKRPFGSYVGVSSLVQTMCQTLPAEELLSVVNNNVELSKQVYDTELLAFPETIPNSNALLRFRELEDLPLPEYAINRYPIYEKGVNLLYGVPGVGKSLIALDFIGHLAAANPDSAIVYIAPEGWASIPVRWKAWCDHNHLAPINTFIRRQALRLTNVTEVNAFRESCKAIEMKIHYIVIDTLARSMAGDNENDTNDMNLFMDAAERLASELDCGILFIHHVNKQGIMRGSTIIEGVLESTIKVTKDDNQLILFNQGDKGGKNRHREEASPIFLNFVQVQVNAAGVENTAVVVELGEREIKTPSQETLTARQKEMLEALDSYDEGMSVKQLQTSTGIPQPTVYRYAKLLQQAGYIKHDRQRDCLVITPVGKQVYQGNRPN
jgi:hypothetical protein